MIKIASIPVILAGIIAIKRFKQFGPELKAFSYFIFLSCFIEIISKSLWFLRIPNLSLLHLYVLLGFILQSLFYAKVLKGFISEKVIWILVLFFSVFTVLNSFLFQDLNSFNSNALTVQSVIIIILSISTYMLFLNDIVKKKTDINLVKSLNWINSGFFLYYSSSLLIFYLGDFISKNYSPILNQYTWAIHTMFLIVMYGCFMIGLNRNFKKT